MTISTLSETRLSNFKVTRLYDEFNHNVPLNLEEHVTAIIAPNGMGKTLCLKFIQSLFDQNWFFFENTSFKIAVFEFTDGTQISIKKAPRGALDLENKNTDTEFSIEYKSSKENLPETINRQAIDVGSFGWVRREAPYMRRISSSHWIDNRDGERISTAALHHRFGHASRKKPRSKHETTDNEDGYLKLSEFLNRINCKLIETQRLIIFDEEAEENSFRIHSQQTSTYAISKKANALKDIISAAISEYASLSQTLDRTFPHRVIKSNAVVIADDISNQLVDLENRRKDLMDVGILDAEEDSQIILAQEKMEESLARVLSVYIEDNRQKLDTLNDIYERVRLFRELISERFGRKQVSISKKTGIDVLFNENLIHLEALSSGEQHQLVLFFELLFEIEPNTLILIDEPEISLHVAWQKKFISDLMKIIELNKFDVVLATHSPQLIGKWVDLAVELGDVN